MPKHNWLANCCLFVDIQNKLNSGFALTELSPETCTSNSQNYDVCVTKHGQALVRILGATDEVKQFDKARKRVKDFQDITFIIGCDGNKNFTRGEGSEASAEVVGTATISQNIVRAVLLSIWIQIFTVNDRYIVSTYW